MPLRICSYNLEWFDHMFNSDNSLKTGPAEQERLNAVASVLGKIKPDLVGIVEAPNTTANGQESTVVKLENFAQDAGLAVRKAITGYISSGLQELALLYNPDKLTVTLDQGGDTNSRTNPPFDGEFYFDTDEDRIKEVYKHYRPPLEAKVKKKQSTGEFWVILAHTKSKGIFNSMDMLHWERESRRNRLKLFAECEWIRQRVDEWLGKGRSVVVMGDINDGPEMDYYEFKTGRSAMETIMGDIFQPDQLLKYYIGRPKWTSKGWKPSSTRFKDKLTETYVSVLIDHVLVSSDLPVVANAPHQIWNPFENAQAAPLKADLLKASDHFPVTLDLDI